MISKKQKYLAQRIPISTPRILKQLRFDLIGKDSQRGVTLTYSWLANQFGHFSLGFIPTIIIYFHTKNAYLAEDHISICASSVSILWFFFELYNFLGPLLVQRVSLSKFFYLGIGKKYTFAPAWKNIAFDTFTDLCFFGLGASSASLLISPSKFHYAILLVFVLILIFPTIHWYHTKMYQYYARYPFQFRLSQWNYDISPEDKSKVYRFMKSKTGGHHLLIFGHKECPKTSLCVGILNELSIQHKACLYTTAIKLFDLFTMSKDIFKDPHLIWTWKKAEFMVIDDINPSNSSNMELIDPNRFLEYVDTPSDKIIENRATLAAKNIIWVLGNPEDKQKCLQDWSEMLLKIGVDHEQIDSITLPYSKT